MIYKEAVEYIHSLLKFGIRPGLTGMDALLRFLGNPQDSLKYVHIAGTNGKGSVSTALSNVLCEAGYSVGLYTSPFVSDFLERIQFCNKPVNKEIFAKNVVKVKEAVDKLKLKDIVITEFEALTAAAFLCFKDLNCDIVVLEVGLGGRLDATNIIREPLLNVITSLSMDHVAVLGDTIEKIAYEKCGTIKDNGNVVCSFGQMPGAEREVRKTVKEHNCNLVIPNESSVEILKADIYGTEFIYENKKYLVSMPGLHQVKNMTCVIEGANVLKKYFNISYENVYKGIAKTFLPARVEVLNKNPLVIIDGGHNEDGARAFYNAVKDVFPTVSNVYVVGGMMADKEVENSLRPLLCKCDMFISVTPQNPRSMTAEELSAVAQKYCKNVYPIDEPEKAIDFVLKKLNPNDCLFIVGSLYLAGEIRNYLIEKLKDF